MAPEKERKYFFRHIHAILTISIIFLGLHSTSIMYGSGQSPNVNARALISVCTGNEKKEKKKKAKKSLSLFIHDHFS